MPNDDAPELPKGTASLFALAAPVALSQLAQISMHIVDTYFVGKLGAVPLGGVSIGGALYSAILVTAIGLLFGLDFPLARAFGAGRREEANRFLVQGIYLTLAISVPSTLAMIGLGGLLPRFGIDPLVVEQAQPFIFVIAFSILPSLLFMALRQYLQAMTIAMPILFISIAANVLNALGNWLFVFGNWGFPALGAKGSAYATILARVWMFVAVAAYLLSLNRSRSLELFRTPLAYSRERFREILKLGLPASFQMLLEVGVFAFVTILVGKISAAQLAAHQIALQMASFTFMVPLGISSAAASIVGRKIGAGLASQARATGWRAIGLAAAFMTGCAIVFSVFARELIGFFTSDAEVIAFGASLVFAAAAFQIFDGIQVVATGALRGIGNTRASLVANLCGHWFLGLPLGAYLGFKLGKGALGLWVGLATGLVFVSLSLLAVWWKKSSALRAA